MVGEPGMTTDSQLGACSDRRIARVLFALAQDLTRRPTLDEAAKIAGLAPTYFSKCFRNRVGITFAEWSSRLRIAEAKALLQIADLSITAIAAAVGYADVTTFDRVFRRIEGTCPREHRRLLHSATKVRNAESNARNAETDKDDARYKEWTDPGAALQARQR
jgi:transcriptional regulator GlxA family with amidase domain